MYSNSQFSKLLQPDGQVFANLQRLKFDSQFMLSVVYC